MAGAMPRWKLIVTAAVTVMVAVSAGVLARPLIAQYTNAAPPEQFDRPLSAPPNTHGRAVITVAHNAGNHPDTTAAALRLGADAIEIDVITVDGELAAGRAHGWRWLAELVFRGQSLAEAWDAARAAKIIQLDLQETDRGLLKALTKFLRHRPPGPRIMVSTRSSTAIRYLRPRLPSTVSLLFTVPFPDAVTKLRTTPALAHAIDGITVFDGLVSADLVTWAHTRQLSVLAWTVNDEQTLNRLLRLGVDGIATDNLAIISALSH
jgi:glycerophosphoryl diester phosphodiesterase